MSPYATDESSEEEKLFYESTQSEEKTTGASSRLTSGAVFEFLYELCSPEHGTISVHVDANNEPYASGRIGKKAVTDMPVFGNELPYIIYSELCQKFASLAPRETLFQIQAFIKGLALSRGSTLDTEVVLERLLRGDPRLEIVVSHFLSKATPQLELAWDTYFDELRKYAREKGSVSLRAMQFPAGSNSLSRWLKTKRPTLKQFGIEFETFKSECRKCILRRIGDASQVSPEVPSGRTEALSSDYDISGDKDALAERLREHRIPTTKED